MSDPEFVALFRGEASGRLDEMVRLLLELEAGRGGADTVDALFREAHSLKGGAAMVELDELCRIAHAVEDVLHDARGEGALPASLVEPLLTAADAMRALLDGAPAGDTDFLADLATAAGPAPAEPEAAAESKPQLTSEPAAEQRAIRVAPEKIDHLLDLVGESLLHRRRLEHAIGTAEGGSTRLLSDELDLGQRLLGELKEAAVGMRTLPVSAVTGALPRALRDAARKLGKEAELVLTGADTELDRVILESLADPLAHLIRNAVAHGVETREERIRAGKDPVARVELRAVQRGGSVEIVVADDGRGVSRSVVAEAQRSGSSLTEVLTQPGFSTSDTVTELSGRGVGLDAVRAHVEEFGGTLEVRSEEGRGTEIVFVLPLALALLEVLLVERGGNVYAIPLGHVEEAIVADQPLKLGGERRIDVRGGSLRLADIADVLEADAPALSERAPAVIVEAAGRRGAISCDHLLGEEEVVVKAIGPLLRGIAGYLGAAILGDGRIALIVEPSFLVRPSSAARLRREVETPAPATAEHRPPKLLVVEDSLTVRELQRSILEAAGYRVTTACDGREGLNHLLGDDEIELVLTDVEMPHMSGFELTEAIRASDAHSSTPVVILTSLADDSFRQRGVEAGADAYMMKRDFGQEALLDTVARLVG